MSDTPREPSDIEMAQARYTAAIQAATWRQAYDLLALTNQPWTRDRVLDMFLSRAEQLEGMSRG
jgi:hypothetical protein